MSDSQTDDPRLKQIREALEQVKDPEIPDLSIVELGMIAGISADGDSATVDLTPTFAACPAIELLRAAVRTSVGALGFAKVDVRIVFDPPWNSDRITPIGLEKLKLFGLAPPHRMDGRSVEMHDLHNIRCPYCNSLDTTLESSFGPTLCRAIHYCNACRQSFEQFKPVS